LAVTFILIYYTKKWGEKESEIDWQLYI